MVVVGTLLSINSTMGSSVASNEISTLQKVYHFPDGSQEVLPATTYLIGFVLGPLVFAPLSEQYGRRTILIATLCLYTVFAMASALAPNWAAFLVFRFLSGTFASPPMSVTGGSIADVYQDRVARGQANVMWSTATLVGPLAGPVLAGYTSQYAWRWAFWACMMLSGICLVALLLQPETLANKILRDRASKLNEEKGGDRYFAPGDQERLGLLATLVSLGSPKPIRLRWSNLCDVLLTPSQKITTTRPLHLMCTELLVTLTCVYMAFVYAVFYM